MEDFKTYANYGMTLKRDQTSFYVYKDRSNYFIMSISYGYGVIDSIIWQGVTLHVRTNEGVLFIYRDFYTYEII